MSSITGLKRSKGFDVIRIVAIFSVVLVHVSGFFLFKYPDPSRTEYFVGNIFNGVSRAGVPLFVMLSGALLLNENKKFDTKTFFRKSLVWIAFLLVGWRLFYALFYSVILPLCTGSGTSAEAFVDYLLTFKGSNYPHLWYLFMVVGAYLLIPILRLFVKKENRSYIYWFIIGCIIVQFTAKTLDVLVPTDAAITVSGFVGKFHLESMTGYIGYLLLGWYLSTFALEKIQRVILYIVGFGAAVFGIVVVQIFYTSIPGIRGYFYSELALGPMIYGIAVFVLILQLCKDKNTTSKVTIALSNYSFGIYIIHVFYLELFTNIIIPYEGFSCGVLLYILISYGFVILASLLTATLIGKIPYIKKIFFIK